MAAPVRLPCAWQAGTSEWCRGDVSGCLRAQRSSRARSTEGSHLWPLHLPQRFAEQCCRSSAQDGVNPDVLEMMKSGSYFFKHDFGRNKRSRKHMKLSGDGLSLKWKAVGANETVAADTPGASSGGIFRSSSFSRTTSSAHAPANSPRPPRAVADSCSFSDAAAAKQSKAACQHRCELGPAAWSCCASQALADALQHSADAAHPPPPHHGWRTLRASTRSSPLAAPTQRSLAH